MLTEISKAQKDKSCLIQLTELSESQPCGIRVLDGDSQDCVGRDGMGATHRHKIQRIETGYTGNSYPLIHFPDVHSG